MAYLSDNLPSFAIVVGENGSVVNGEESSLPKTTHLDKRLVTFEEICKQIESGITVLKQRKPVDIDEALCWRRAKEFETRVKRQNFELKQKIQLFKSKGTHMDSLHCNQALRIGRNILVSYAHYLPLSPYKLTPDGILHSFDLLCSLFGKLNGGKMLVESIHSIRSLLLSQGSHTNVGETKKLIADLARIKFGNKPNERKPIKNVRSNALLHKRIQRSKAIRHGVAFSEKDPDPKLSSINNDSTHSIPHQTPSSNDEASLQHLFSRLADLESGIENALASSNSLSDFPLPRPSSPKEESTEEASSLKLDISDSSLKEIQAYWNPPTKVSDFIQVELCINKILDCVLMELSEEMTSPSLILDILHKELL